MNGDDELRIALGPMGALGALALAAALVRRSPLLALVGAAALLADVRAPALRGFASLRAPRGE